MDLQKLMEQAKKMQEELGAMEQELGDTVYIGKSGGSEGVMVKVNGRNEAQEITLPKELIPNDDDREMLQDLILIAFNEAVANASEDREARLGAATSGLQIPGM
ncbi:MAG TPA: nucleoid-associated protein, YbaB/EbfC family [Erysipelotrichaceae bacterium]|nr:nucleoid-associated protein, YbaB/EbfC family [Erysipelotrichaceae bacterium]